MRKLDLNYAQRRGYTTDYEDLSVELHADIVVNDGDKVQAGDMVFEVIALPGHTKCSVGYYLAENKLLLGPETLGVYDGKSKVIPHCFSSCKMTLDSYDKIAKFDVNAIVSPHYGYIEGDTVKFYFSEGKRNIDVIKDKVADILGSGGSVEDAMDYYIVEFYYNGKKGRVPAEATKVNARAMVEMLKKEYIDN